MLEFLRPICVVRSSFRDCLGVWMIIYELNCVLVIRRPEMGMEVGSIKRNRCRMSGLPVDSPHALFWDYKNSPSLCEMAIKVHVFWH